jgi:hypothetical protein
MGVREGGLNRGDVKKAGAAILVVFASACAPGQRDVSTVLADAQQAMGTRSLTSIAYSGVASEFGVGQSERADGPWPLIFDFNVTYATDFTKPLTRRPSRWPIAARRRRSSSLNRIRRPRSCPFSTRFSSRRNSITSRCSHSSQPNSAARTRWNGTTRGVYVETTWTQFSDTTASGILGLAGTAHANRRAAREPEDLAALKTVLESAPY